MNNVVTGYSISHCSHGYVVVREFANGDGETRGTFTTRREATAYRKACEAAEAFGMGDYRVMVAQ